MPAARQLSLIEEPMALGDLATDPGANYGEVFTRRWVVDLMHAFAIGVATLLVDEGKVLKAQARLGHRDPSTTLRQYSRAVALQDEDVADALDALLNGG